MGWESCNTSFDVNHDSSKEFETVIIAFCNSFAGAESSDAFVHMHRFGCCETRSATLLRINSYLLRQPCSEILWGEDGDAGTLQHPWLVNATFNQRTRVGSVSGITASLPRNVYRLSRRGRRFCSLTRSVTFLTKWAERSSKLQHMSLSLENEPALWVFTTLISARAHSFTWGVSGIFVF